MGTRTPTEKSPLRSGPDFELAMTRSRLRLVHNPKTGLPYAMWGVCVDTNTFGDLGGQAYAHVRFLGSALWMAFGTAVVGVVLMSSGGVPPDPSNATGDDAWAEDRWTYNAGTAAGWSELTWVTVLSDALITTAFIAFVMRQQYLLVKPDRPPFGLQHAFEERVAPLLQRSISSRVEHAMDGKGMAFLPTGTVKEEYKEEVQAFEDLGAVLHASHLVEACSVVVSGWGAGQQPPAGLLSAIEEAAGSSAVAAVQPMACFESVQAVDKQAQAALSWTEAQMQGAGPATERARAALDAANSALERQQILDESYPAALDYLFVTLPSSAAKTRVIEAARRGALLPHAAPLPRGAQVYVTPAPNPRDVLWTNLEATAAERRRSNALVLCVLAPLAVVNGTLVAFLVLPMTLRACGGNRTRCSPSIPRPPPHGTPQRVCTPSVSQTVAHHPPGYCTGY